MNNLAAIILGNNMLINNDNLIENRIIDNVLQESFNEKNPIKYVINDDAKKNIIFEKFDFIFFRKTMSLKLVKLYFKLIF